ncbi:MACPF domain-containing protein NSL1, partial [Linum grandiflorum]
SALPPLSYCRFAIWPPCIGCCKSTVKAEIQVFSLRRDRFQRTLQYFQIHRRKQFIYLHSNQRPFQNPISPLLYFHQTHCNFIPRKIHLLAAGDNRLAGNPMSRKSLDPRRAAEKAVSVIGFGYDLSNDVRLSSCKPGPSGSKLVELDPKLPTRDLVVPGGIVVKDVWSGIKCDKGERTRFSSDVLSFNQMSEKLNRELTLSGKIPTGMFNSMFDFKGCWAKDAGSVKSLAFDGWFITLYNIELDRSHLTLSESVKAEVPNSWDPQALAEFIEKYGTHIVVGVKMGGKDVIHIKQLKRSNLDATQVQKLLKQLADERFSQGSESSPKPKVVHGLLFGVHGSYAASIRPPVVTSLKNEGLVSIGIRRGGVDVGQSHNQWLPTIVQSPNVISMSLVPITSLLSGVRGNGFLTHAVNLYLRYKPPIEELQQFLEFQLPRQWAPIYGDLPLTLRRRKQASPSLRFTLMGPKLYVNTTMHLSSIPNSIQLENDDHDHHPTEQPERGYLEPVNWTIFSHVCTAPVQYDGARIDDTASIVTKARLEVKVMGLKKVLFLRLGFSMVTTARIRRSEWDGPANTMSRKSGIFSTLMFSTNNMNPTEQEVVGKVDLNSAIFPRGPPLPVRAPKMSSFVDTREMVRGPEDSPGYWVMTGAKLCVEEGRISIKGKYSLLAMISEECLMFM